MNESDFKQATVLWAAGWVVEGDHSATSDIMSYYWRRPPKRKGKEKGRLFLSTNQAHIALMKEPP